MNDIAKRPSLIHRGPPDGSKIINPLGLCRQSELNNSYNWGVIDILRWKVWPECLGGDRKALRKYKDTWVAAHSETIKKEAARFRISIILLAGVCWIEVGGDPDWIDSVAYANRKFDHSGDPLLEPITITKKPELTSFGDVSIQLRRAAEAADLDIKKLNSNQKDELIKCLSDEDINIAFVAKHLYQLKKIDKICFTEYYEIKIIGTRYNRGPSLSLKKIEANTSYGDFILKFKSHLETLLQ